MLPALFLIHILVDRPHSETNNASYWDVEYKVVLDPFRASSSTFLTSLKGIF